jgi:hypothetical protein
MAPFVALAASAAFMRGGCGGEVPTTARRSRRAPHPLPRFGTPDARRRWRPDRGVEHLHPCRTWIVSMDMEEFKVFPFHRAWWSLNLANWASGRGDLHAADSCGSRALPDRFPARVRQFAGRFSPLTIHRSEAGCFVCAAHGCNGAVKFSGVCRLSTRGRFCQSRLYWRTSDIRGRVWEGPDTICGSTSGAAEITPDGRVVLKSEGFEQTAPFTVPTQAQCVYSRRAG